MNEMSKNTNVVRLPVASLLVLALFACEGPEPDELADVQSLRAVILDDVCPAHTQIARIDAGGGCPLADDWIESALFADASGELAKFCRYEWDGYPGQEDLAAITSELDSADTVSPDCDVVLEQVPSSDALWAAVGTEIEALFHHAIGRADGYDLDLANTEGSRSPVLVVVVDSVPEGAPTPRSEHGELMASIVDDIACPEPDPDPNVACAVRVRRSLGLPRWGPNHVIDEINGGYYGSQTDIATAIYDSVESWRTKVWPGEIPKLIINLSVGWEGEFGGEDVLDMPPPAESTYAAMQYANCHGAILIAAAGNQGHLCTDGPLLPGGWEAQPAPDAARCAELSVLAPPVGGAYKPLVYSVGGLDSAGEPMPGARLEGMPRLAAAATHAVAVGDSTALTGTSVASAVATAAAALVWSYNPHLDPAKVMGSVYGGGEPLAELADYMVPGPFNPIIHEIDVCGALVHACARPSSNCPTSFDSTLACLTAPAPTTIDQIFADIAASESVPWTLSFPGPFESIACDNGCDLAYGYLSSTLDVSVDPCPAPITPELPYVEPMPTEVACPNCTLDVNVNSHVVYASLDPSYTGIDVLDVTVSVVGPTATNYFRLGQVPLSATTITSIVLDSTFMPDPIVSASISIAFDSVTMPRPVVDDLLLD